jgi:hypothetical protein
MVDAFAAPPRLRQGYQPIFSEGLGLLLVGFRLVTHAFFLRYGTKLQE